MNRAKHILFVGLTVSTFAAMTVFPLQAADRQTANASWDGLKTLKPVQEIRVVLNDVKSYQGEYQAFSDDGITLRQAAGEQTLTRKTFYVCRQWFKSGGRETRSLALPLEQAPVSPLEPPPITTRETVETRRRASARLFPISAWK